MRFHPKWARITLTLALVVATPAEARKHTSRPSPQAPEAPGCEEEPAAGAQSLMVPQFTGYAPALGGVNGSCNGGASKHLGFAACRDTLQKYIAGSAKFIHVAAQQKGGSAVLFGCWAKTTDAFTGRKIANAPGKSCHVMAIVDHYGGTENAGGRGINGRRTGTKMDIEVTKLDASYKKLGTPFQGNISCVKRVPGMQNRDKANPRTISRRRKS